MKTDLIGQAGSGFMLSAVTVFAQFGTTWQVVVMAIIGAILAVLEMEVRRTRTVVQLVIFNVLVGSLAAPIVVEKLGLEQHVAAVVIMGLLGGYIGHDLFLAVRGPIRNRIAKMAGGTK